MLVSTQTLLTAAAILEGGMTDIVPTVGATCVLHQKFDYSRSAFISGLEGVSDMERAS